MPPYNGAQVDALLVQFEACAQRTNAVKSSQVKLRAAESDLLKVAEKVRDLLLLAVKGDKHHLADVFGGAGLQRFHRFRNSMDTVEFSDMYAGDQRWGHLKDAMDTVEEILKQLGQFKPFMLHGPPDAIMYKGVPSSFVAGQPVNLMPEIEGGEPSSFTVEPPLPEGLSISLLGEIAGTLPADTPPQIRECRITASNGAGSAKTVVKFSILPPAPQNLTYSSDIEDLIVGEAVQVEAKCEGGVASAFSVEPALPKGLELDTSTGAIRGTPLKSTPSLEYEITATNDSGSTSAKLKFGVKPAAPVSLTYPELRPAYPHASVMHVVPEVQFKGKDGQPLASQVTSTLMEDLEFTISPELPPGLSLIKKTGVITGTPSEATKETEYHVTVQNAAGEASTDITFAIKLNPPSGLQYPGAGCVTHTGEPFSLSPQVEGVVQEWAIEPALPKGLVFDSAMGAISGIPSEVTAEGASWTVTAKNAEGETSSTVSFVVKRAAPSGLSYPSLLGAYPVRRPVEGLLPTFAGEVDEFSISPALPAGLELNTSTGEIKGTPKEVTEERTYEVVAKNDTGSTTSSLKFAVHLISPEDLKYPQIDDVYHVGEEVRLEPTIEGGVTSWQIEPELPAGLVFDESTGSITGAPTDIVDEQQYVVTASNEAGGTSAVLTFKVIAPKPEGLSYPQACDSYEVGQEVRIEPEAASCMFATYTVKPDLPPGLTLDSKTGEISGAPEQVADLKEYTVTATNSGGSTSTKIKFEVKEAPTPELEADEAFAAQLEDCTDVASLPAQPLKRLDWMLWMVHRAWLNDPTLDNFVFTNMKMPLPHEDPRIAPKLMKALEHNTCITNLELGNSNLQRPQGPQLAQALRQNKTLKVLNVDTNNLDAECITLIANALEENPESGVEQLRLNNQKTLGENIGRTAEEALAKYVNKSSKLVKLGCHIADANWRYVVDKAILRNIDADRRRRKAGRGSLTTLPEKVLTKIELNEPPAEKAAWELFPQDDEKLSSLCLAVSEARQLPTRERFQAFAKGKGVTVGYSQTAPLLKKFTTTLMQAMVGASLTVTDDKKNEFVGKLRSFEEKNDRWSLDVHTDMGPRAIFVASKAPILKVSEAFADWIEPEA